MKKLLLLSLSISLIFNTLGFASDENGDFLAAETRIAGLEDQLLQMGMRESDLTAIKNKLNSLAQWEVKSAAKVVIPFALEVSVLLVAISKNRNDLDLQKRLLSILEDFIIEVKDRAPLLAAKTFDLAVDNLKTAGLLHDKTIFDDLTKQFMLNYPINNRKVWREFWLNYAGFVHGIYVGSHAVFFYITGMLIAYSSFNESVILTDSVLGVLVYFTSTRPLIKDWRSTQIEVNGVSKIGLPIFRRCREVLGGL